jgi:hypothetical protein
MSDTRLALSDVQGPLKDLIDKLTGENGDTWLKAFKLFLRKQNPWEIPTVKEFMEIEIGGWSNTSLVREALKSVGVRIDPKVEECSALERTSFNRLKCKKIHLAVVSVGELGFKSVASLAQIYTALKDLGLELCPRGAAASFRLAYFNQPLNETLFMAMETVTTANMPVIYAIRRNGFGDGRLWLDIHNGYPDTLFARCDRFVAVIKE